MIDKIIDFFTKFTMFSLFILVVLVVYDATMRYVFSSGSIALQELEWHLFDVVILVSIAYTLKTGSHVRVDIVYDRLERKTKSFINLLSLLFFIIPFSMLIIYIGFHFVELSFIQNEASSNPGGLPFRWIVKSLLPLSFVLLILQALSEIKNEILELKR